MDLLHFIHGLIRLYIRSVHPVHCSTLHTTPHTPPPSPPSTPPATPLSSSPPPPAICPPTPESSPKHSPPTHTSTAVPDTSAIRATGSCTGSGEATGTDWTKWVGTGCVRRCGNRIRRRRIGGGGTSVGGGLRRRWRQRWQRWSMGNERPLS